MFKKVLKLSMLIGIAFGLIGCTEPEEDKIDYTEELNDPRFVDLDLATAKIYSHKTGESTMQIGTGFYFDLDEKNNKLYLITNNHVVSNIDHSSEYVLVEPVGYYKTTTLPKLCGKVVYYDYTHSPSAENIDIAIVELFSKVGNAVNDPSQCITRSSVYDFVENQDKFHLLDILGENTPLNSIDVGSHHISAGFPNGNYLRKVYSYYTMQNMPFESDLDANKVPKYYWNYEQLIFRGATQGGASGSAIIDSNNNVIAVLSFGYNGQDFTGGVSYRSVWKVIKKFCNSSTETYSFQNLKHCE